MKLFLIIFLLKTIESKIIIDIYADNINPTISYSGTGIQKATPRDMRQLFFIDDTSIKKYVTTYFNNTRPRKVLYSSPTSNTKRNLREKRKGLTPIHKRFNWDPVVLSSSVKSARKKDIHDGSSIFLSRVFKNPTNNTKTINAGIQMPVAIALETAWYYTFYPFSDTYESNHDIVYDINVHFNESSGTADITHTTTLGRSSRVYEHIVIGKSKYEVVLKPGKSVVANFSAKICNLEMQAEVVTSVGGNLAVNFKEAVNGRHWWGPKIEDVLKNVNISTVSLLEENLIVRLDYYYDVRIELFDKETGLPL